jgi:CHAD domain-containing protein
MQKVDSTAVRTARRLCAARIAAAIRALSGRPSDDRVHLARRELKRARALLRLVRAALPATAYVAAKTALHDVARMLGAARDAAVQRALLRELAAATGVPLSALRPLLARLDRELRVARAAIDVRQARNRLATARARLLGVRLEGDGELLATGFVRIYRRGRRGYASARELPRPARLHDWRKHVKHYWHALEALEPAWPRLITALAAEADRLADVLGTHHDCALLAARIETAPLAKPVRLRLAAELARRRAALRLRAFAIGERFYEERPRRLAPRAAQWWQLWIDATPADLMRAARAGPAPVAWPIRLSSAVRARGG